MNIFQPPPGEDEQHSYHTALEEKVEDIISPFQEFINSQTVASALLLLATISALIFASFSGLSHYYEVFTHIKFSIHISDWVGTLPLHYVINDMLLALFFFYVGLEIKREFLVGELTDRLLAVLVLFGALGGVLFPAIIYVGLNAHTQYQHGWGIVIATDTAFALGILSCFRKQLPKGIFTFMAALAIIDDIIAILVIAIFYSDTIQLSMFPYMILSVLILLFMNLAGFRKFYPYLIFGLMLWVFVELSGLHGTLAGIIVALLIPARPKRGPRQFLKKARALLTSFEEQKDEKPTVLEDPMQHQVLEKVQSVAEQATTPLQRWESKLEMPIVLFILPLFALANAGVALDHHLMIEVLKESVSLGILLALVIGKPLGIFLFCLLALRLKVAVLPNHVSLKQFFSVLPLTGIGFTMSLFIATVAFHGHEIITVSKMGIMLGSLLSGVVGAATIVFCNRRHP